MRSLTNYDLPLLQELVGLEKEAFGEGGMNEWIMAPFIRYGRVFILEVEGKIAGVAVLMRKWDEPEMAYLASISVRPDLRGRGLGSRFLRKALEQVMGDKCLKVRLTVDPANKAALRLYFDHFGFEPVRYRRDAYGEGEDRLVMELDLSNLADETTGDGVAGEPAH
ncbi:MAG: GNAT family N-acetyltransferase [Firmicutes bacterium]|nr:GNAT family N-acetyltransferase [Bacillota bacterium]